VLASLLAYPLVDWHLRAIDVAAEYRFWDFGAYGGAVNRWLEGERIYVPDDDGPGYHGSYLYPPVFVLLFAPFTALPPDTAAPVWSACSVAFLWLGLQALVAALGLDLDPVDRGLLLLAVVGFQPLLLSVKLGRRSSPESASVPTHAGPTGSDASSTWRAASRPPSPVRSNSRTPRSAPTCSCGATGSSARSRPASVCSSSRWPSSASALT
jgi:hypothetical protein